MDKSKLDAILDAVKTELEAAFNKYDPVLNHYEAIAVLEKLVRRYREAAARSQYDSEKTCKHLKRIAAYAVRILHDLEDLGDLH